MFFIDNSALIFTDLNPSEHAMYNGGEAMDENGRPIRFIATYRCQNSEKKANIMIRSMEGEFGTLQVYNKIEINACL